MIITSALLGINEQEFVKDFTVIVQFGAIFSVVVLYWRRFLAAKVPFYLKIAAAFMPAAIVGLAVKKKIDIILGDPLIVAGALIGGGCLMIAADAWFSRREGEGSVEKMSSASAVAIGACQCLAFIPGMSRSAATILGGMWRGLSRKEAAEFSFFLAVPTLTAATGVKVIGILPTLKAEQASILLIGNLISFIVGAITIKAFIGLVSQKGLTWFGVYRILAGLLIIGMLATGHSLSMM
jgi:undecaprenyl-diphosphatase